MYYWPRLDLNVMVYVLPEPDTDDVTDVVSPAIANGGSKSNCFWRSDAETPTANRSKSTTKETDSK